MEQIGKNTRCCATCAYWLGLRYPNRLGFIEFNRKTDKGKCGAKSLTESRQYQAIYACSSYCKWLVLK